MKTRLGTLAAVVALGLSLHPAQSATYSVAMYDAYFSPKAVTGTMGSYFRWINRGFAPHTTTSVVWNKSLDRGESWARQLRYAATYAYWCIPHRSGGMTGAVRVPTRVAPLSGSRATSFTVRVATVYAPSGWVYDVQRRRGTGSWVMWKRGSTAPTHTFRAGSLGRGYYYFRSRLRRVSTGVATGFSPSMRIRVA